MEQPLTKVSEGPSDGTWDLYRSTIKWLYLDEDKTLPQVMEIMKRDYDFKASIKMYKRRLRLWKLDGKNLKRPEVKQIARQKVERDAVGKSSMFFIKGREVDMDNVWRYLRKQGISSLEQLNRAASTVTYNYDVVCITPGHSPMSSGNDIRGVESQDVPQNHNSDGLQRNQYCSMALSITGRRSLSISPIPRTLDLPKALSIPEQMLSAVGLYLKAGFEAGIWETWTNGPLLSKNTPGSGNLNWINGYVSANELYGERKYVQFRQMLSQVCRGMEFHIRYESPDFIKDLVYLNNLLHYDDLPGVASTVLSHASSAAATYLGASHPVAQMCGALQKLDAIPRELESRLFKCQLDLLEKELGPWHLSTSNMRSYFFSTVDTSEAVGRARAELAAYELTGLKYDHIWFDSMIDLARTLVDDRQYGNASRVCRDTLDAVDAAIDFDYSHGRKADLFWQLSHIAESASNDIMEAEGYMQLGVVEAAAAFGSQDPVTIRWMLHHARLLRVLGRFDEAGEIETQIQDILGPPEIEELLS